MDIIDAYTVAVETSAELVDVLTNTAYTYTTIYFKEDITLEAGAGIPEAKTEITLDVLYPLDGTGTVHTYTDMNSLSQTSTIYVNTSGSKKSK